MQLKENIKNAGSFHTNDNKTAGFNLMLHKC